jgi:hypothetical protein
MLQITADAYLDALALDKFKQWRFKLGVTIPKAKIP